MHGLMINGHWTTEVNKVKEEVFRFYKKKFTEDHVSRPKLINPLFKTISMMDAIRIESSFSLEEVKATILDRGSKNALGPDGYTFKSFKKYCDIIKCDVMSFVRHFDVFGSLARGVTPHSSHLLLKLKTHYL